MVQRDDPDENRVAGEERPVCYYGKKFSPAENDHSATEAELLGVVLAIPQFRPYLWGRRFRVVTDHAALKWLHNMSGTQEGDPQSRLNRWVIKLQEYDFYVEHKPGKSHVDCDAISRLVAALTPKRRESTECPTRWNERRICSLLEPESKECLRTDLQALTRQKLEQTSTEIMGHGKGATLAENCAALPKADPVKDPLKRKLPRHTVREGSPMEQLFRPMKVEEGGITPALGD